MRQLEDLIAANNIKLIESFVDGDTDLLLLYLAIAVMKISGHRYGAFLDAAATAAKLAIYATYLEQGKNLRKTGFMHHIETRRVKTIVQEVENNFSTRRGLKFLGSKDPQYLIGIPYLWLELYPWKLEDSRTTLEGLSKTDERYLNAFFHGEIPDAKAITDGELIDLIVQMHTTCQLELPEDERATISDAMTEHIKFCLLHSETVIELKLPDSGLSIYGLMKHSYSPKGYVARVQTMLNDTLGYFNILRLWAHQDPEGFRAIETLCIRPERYDEAISELDDFLTRWADKYHEADASKRIVSYLAIGPQSSRLNH